MTDNATPPQEATKQPRISNERLLQQLNETKQLWQMYVRRAMKPRPTTIASLEKKMEQIRQVLDARDKAKESEPTL